MTEHLSREEIDNYIARELAPGTLLRVDDHLSACSQCMSELSQTPKADIGMIRRALHPEHPEYEQLSAFVDGSLDETGREWIETHRSSCSECEKTIYGMETLRDALTTQQPPVDATVSWIAWRFGWLRFAIPAMAAVLVGVFVWAYWSGGGKSVETADSSEVAAPSEPENTTLAADVPSESNSEQESDPRKVVASVVDGGGRIEIDANGKVSGISTGQFEQKIKAALTNADIDISHDARQLRASKGVLMGPGAEGVPFELTGPLGRVVQTQRPTFTWRPVKGAETYRVGVYTDNFERIAESPDIRGTSWTAGNTLPRGRVYQWQVTAVVDGKEVTSPVRPAAEAKFKVLDAANAAEIEQARRIASKSHLVMGMAYAKAGLLDDAEREFRALAQANPNSEVARKLLQKVRSAK